VPVEPVGTAAVPQGPGKRSPVFAASSGTVATVRVSAFAALPTGVRSTSFVGGWLLRLFAKACYRSALQLATLTLSQTAGGGTPVVRSHRERVVAGRKEARAGGPSSVRARGRRPGLACEPAPAHVWCDGHPADAHHFGLNGSD
jgi:hypothetical protein